jgi:hypothetical protein
MRRLCLPALSFLITIHSVGQGINRDIQHAIGDTVKNRIVYTVHGIILDKETNIPVEDANLTFDSTRFVGTHTDKTGEFTLTRVPLGKHHIKVTHIQYETTVLMVDAGPSENVVLEFRLQPKLYVLNGLVVDYDWTVGYFGELDEQGNPINESPPLGTNRIYDPSVVQPPGTRAGEVVRGIEGMQPNVQCADDTRNDAVIRGNSPYSVVWNLEGVTVPNPNHFALPGTAGGPVTIISGRTLSSDNSSFVYGSFPSQYGNTVSGTFDLNLRNGSANDHYLTGEFGVLGASLLAEGPLLKNKASFMVSGRVSTVPLFDVLNLNLGVESIPKYHDASVVFNIRTGQNSFWKFFGVEGSSNIDIVISQQSDPFSNLYGEKDRDQYFGSNMFVVGIRFDGQIGKQASIQATLARSGQYLRSNHDLAYPQDDVTLLKQQDNTLNDPRMPPVQWYAFDEERLSSRIHYSIKPNGSRKPAYFHAGVVSDLFFLSYRDSARNLSVPTSDAQFGSWRRRWWAEASPVLVQPYAEYKFGIDSVEITAGLHSQFFTLNNSASWLEPRLLVVYVANKHKRYSITAGMYSQTQPLNLYFYDTGSKSGTDQVKNKGLDFTRSIQTSMGIERIFRPDDAAYNLKVEAYFQYLYNVPVDIFSSSFSLLNTGADFTRVLPDSTLINQGTGTNFGIELTMERKLLKGFMWLLSGSVFQSKYKASDNLVRGTDFNGGYVLNLLLNKEFMREMTKRNNRRVHKVITVGFKSSLVGGRRFGPADEPQSVVERVVVPIDELRNTEQFKPYLRLDAMASIRWSWKKWSLEAGVDVVNASNRRNILRQAYYPDLKSGGRVDLDYQLGFIPFGYIRSKVGW